MGEAFICRRGGSGGRYALLTVTTEEPDLQSAQVTVSGTDPNTGRVDRQSKNFSSGIVQFRLKFLTDYTVSCGDISGVVSIAYYADDYRLEITSRKDLFVVDGRDDPYCSLDWTGYKASGGAQVVELIAATDESNGYYRLYSSGEQYKFNVFTTVLTKVDVTNYNSIKFIVEATSPNNTVMGLIDQTITGVINLQPSGFVVSNTVTDTSKQTVTVDVTDITGSYNVAVSSYLPKPTSGAAREVKVYEIWAE